DQKCWTSKPGQSFPPALTAPVTIGAIVATSIGQAQGTIYGNIASIVAIAVDPQPPVGTDPGKPGFGVITNVIADGANLFPPPAAIVATATQPATALPGQPVTVAIDLAAGSATAAAQVAVSETFDGLLPASATQTVARVDQSAHQAVSFAETAVAVPVRAATESSLDYQDRPAS